MTLPQTIGKYRVVGRIGSGAMGEVYKAFDPVRACRLLKVDLKTIESKTTAAVDAKRKARQKA